MKRFVLVLAGASLLACGDGNTGGERTGSAAEDLGMLMPVASFGNNPGNLQMYAYVPAAMPANAPLVLALHGCTETASDYQAAGWNALADMYKFYVVYPQQQSQNNPEMCFNWAGEYGNLADITRDQGEAGSVKQMVDAMKARYSIDGSRVFATGFSAGAAFAVAMLALYPDVFAGGASFSGVAFKCATTLPSAITCMSSPTSQTPMQWGNLARTGDPGYSGPYPRISIWQGTGDTTVNPANLAQLVAQWTTVTGASPTPTTMDTVGGFPHAEYADSSGKVRVESYSITGMTHAVAIDPSNGCGTAGAYDIDEKVCAVDRVAKFLGLEGASGGTSSGGGSGGTGSGAGSGSGGNAAGADGGACSASHVAGCALSAARTTNGDAGAALGVAAIVAGVWRRRRRRTTLARR